MRVWLSIFVAALFMQYGFAADRTSQTARVTLGRATTTATTQGRSAVAITSLPGRTAQNVAARPGQSRNVSTRTGVAASSVVRAISSRAAVPVNPENVQALGDGYAMCRDAYFTCMDQFCALRDDQYKRCMCSSRLQKVRERERDFASATTMLKTFEENNLNVVGKTPDEVKVMYRESEGEALVKKDTSATAASLSGISEILAAKSKDSSQNMANAEKIWTTTGLVGGGDISSLESTALYNAVHAQCAEMSASSCSRVATFGMVTAAYGMYIEQDCTAYANSLDKKQTAMVSATKQAERELAAARLANYDSHNSAEILDCLENVRKDMFGEAGCGKDNIKCVDYTGRFINVTTGEPIYTPDFFMLENAISLSGDTLQNSENATYVNMLTQKKYVARASLDKCRDVADDVWDEYMRQTLIDLSQRQFAKVRDVQSNCVSVVNKCYDEKLEQLRQFASDLAQENVNAQQIGLTEQLCEQELSTCAILYGGGPPGLQKLLQYVRNSQTMKLENTCEKYLTDYITSTCTPVNDNLHGFPYQCRFYRPGHQQDALYGDTLYGRLQIKAVDVCARQDTKTLTNETSMIISKIMDKMKLDMDGLLQTECKAIDGAVWHTRTLGSWDVPTDEELSHMTDEQKAHYVQSSEYRTGIGANDEWGICAKP